MTGIGLARSEDTRSRCPLRRWHGTIGDVRAIATQVAGVRVIDVLLLK